MGLAARAAIGAVALQAAEASPHVGAVQATAGIATSAERAAMVATGADPPQTALVTTHGGAGPALAGLAPECVFAGAAMGGKPPQATEAGASILIDDWSKAAADSSHGAVASAWLVRRQRQQRAKRRAPPPPPGLAAAPGDGMARPADDFQQAGGALVHSSRPASAREYRLAALETMLILLDKGATLGTKGSWPLCTPSPPVVATITLPLS